MPLGRSVSYTGVYTPSLLCAMERSASRVPMGIAAELPFHGDDLWTAYEFSWLNGRGRPETALVRIDVPCTSPCIVESKSMKLYLNSFAETRFSSRAEVLATLNSDLGVAFRAPVVVELFSAEQLPPDGALAGRCLDDLEVAIEHYERAPELLRLEDDDSRVVHETDYTHLFRSLCPVTGQPDFATVIVSYSGRPMVREALLAYLVSFRNHQAFHEATIEQIYLDLRRRCRPERLSVYGRFLRRGGIDINPFRSSEDEAAPMVRLPRQ